MNFDRLANFGLCKSTKPDGSVGCTLAFVHWGEHQNRSTGEQWENLGTGPCSYYSEDIGRGCLKDKSHDGKHQNGTFEWE